MPFPHVYRFDTCEPNFHSRFLSFSSELVLSKWLKKAVIVRGEKNQRGFLQSSTFRERRFIRRFHRVSWDIQELSFRSLKNNLIKTQPPGQHSLHPYTPSPVYTE